MTAVREVIVTIFLKKILVIPLGSMLRVGLKRVKTFRIVNTENVMLFSSQLVIEAKCGVSSLSVVYAEAKYLMNACALEKESASCSPL